MSTITHPKNQQQYRERTNNPSMAGVMSPRFWCIACKDSRSVVGRKKTKSGYICRSCAQED